MTHAVKGRALNAWGVALCVAASLLGCDTSDAPTETSGVGLRNMAPTTHGDAVAVEATADREPNDTHERAIELRWEQGRAVATGILTGGAADVDVYRLVPPSPDEAAIGAVTLTPLAADDLLLGVARGKGMVPLYFDNAMAGAPEVVPNVGVVSEGAYLFVVGRGAADLGYQLEVLASAVGTSEIEPNDDLGSAQPLHPGANLTAYANRAGDRDVYVITSTAEEPFDVTVVPPGDLPIDLRLETGQRPVWRHTTLDGKPASYKGLRPQPDGYRLTIELLGETDRPRSYQLSIDRVAVGGLVELEPNDDPALAQALVPGGEVLKGLLAQATDVDRFAVRAQVPAGEQRILHVEAAPAGGLDVVVDAHLVEHGLRWTRNEAGAGGPEGLCNVRLDADSTIELTIQVAPGSSMPAAPATYGLIVATRVAGEEELEPNDTPTGASEVTLGQPIQGYVHPSTDVDVYRFIVPAAVSGAPVKTTVALERGYPANLTLELKDAQLAGVGLSDVSGYGEAETLSADLPTGVYYALVRSASGASCEKPYTLTITAAVPAPGELPDPTLDPGARLGTDPRGDPATGPPTEAPTGGEAELPPEELPVDVDEAPPATLDDF